MNTLPESHTTDLREYVRVFRARKFEILAVTLALVALVLALSLRQTPIYEGRAQVLVKPITNIAGNVGIPINPNLDTERALAASQAVAQKVKSNLGIDTSVDVLRAHVRASVLSDTEVLVVGYDDANPKTAARLANAFADAYVDFRGSQVLSAFQSAASAMQRRIDGIQTELNALNAKIADTNGKVNKASLETQRDGLVAQLGALNQQLLNLQANASAVGQAAQVVQRAEVPRSPVSPNKLRNGALALFAGLILGTGVAFLRERLDDRVKSRQEVERRLGAPVIAAVPRVTTWRRAEEARLVLKSYPRSPVSEAYRTLATNLQYMASQTPLKVIMVTSAMGGDGKTTTCANLAVVLAQSGKRVLLLSADLRRPRLHHFFDLENAGGLSNALADSYSLGELASDPGIPNLRLLNAGEIPADPAALLGSQRASKLLAALRDVADFVLIDTPPVLAVADASILAPLVDGTIFVLDAEHSSRSALVHARDQLENAGARIIGSVFNNFDPTAGASYPYYYYYYYQYRGSEDGMSNGSRAKLPWRRTRRSSSNGHAAWDEWASTKDPGTTSSGAVNPRARRNETPSAD